jgi:hypothetical protein
MRDIASIILNGLRDGTDPGEAGGDEPWSGRASRHAPAGDWCQTGPGGEAIGWLAAQLGDAAARDRRHGT